MHKLTANLISYLPLIIMVVLLSACGAPTQLNLKHNVTAQDIYNDTLFGEPLPIPKLDDVFTLSEAQKQHFLNQFHSKEYRDLSDSQRVFEYLQNHLQHFNFHSDISKTYVLD